MPVHQSLCPFTSWLSPRRRRLLALSRVPSDNLPFACQFPLRNDEFPQFASSALLLLSPAGVSRVILYRIYEFEPSIPVPAPSCKLFYSITGNILLETYTALLLMLLLLSYILCFSADCHVKPHIFKMGISTDNNKFHITLTIDTFIAVFS